MKYHYNYQDIISALKEAGLKKGSNVFIHSNIGFFGRLENATNQKEYYEIFKKAFFDVIGEEGTIIFPTFSYSFCKGEPFDINNTAGVCGFLSEEARIDPLAHRSMDANFSVVAIGKNALYFTEGEVSDSFGNDSFWERFMKEDGVICNLNFDSGSTFVHYIEKQLEVPYRYNKGFEGDIIEVNNTRKAMFYHFVYDHDKREHEPDFKKFHEYLSAAGLVKTAKLGKGIINAVSSREMFEFVKREIKLNPNLLILGSKDEVIE